jgi:hypothetical protein
MANWLATPPGTPRTLPRPEPDRLVANAPARNESVGLNESRQRSAAGTSAVTGTGDTTELGEHHAGSVHWECPGLRSDHAVHFDAA